MNILRDNKGFTPLEIFIAMAILAIGVVGAFRLFPVALRYVRVSQERSIVSEIADSRLSRLRTTGGRNLTVLGNTILATPDFNYVEDPIIDENSPIRPTAYRAYATSLHRIPGLDDAYLHRVTFSVVMSDGRTERFVTYVAEP